MTVEAYLRAKVAGYPVSIEVLQDAALSPVFAKPESLDSLKLTDEIDDKAGDERYVRSLKYALSTLYYSLSGVFSGGSRSEQVGDVKVSMSGYIITQGDRNYYRSMGNRLRREIGSDIEEDTTEQGYAFDATNLKEREGWN